MQQEAAEADPHCRSVAETVVGFGVVRIHPHIEFAAVAAVGIGSSDLLKVAGDSFLRISGSFLLSSIALATARVIMLSSVIKQSRMKNSKSLVLIGPIRTLNRRCLLLSRPSISTPRSILF